MPFRGSTSGTLRGVRGSKASLTVSSKHRTTEQSERLRISLSPLLRSQFKVCYLHPLVGGAGFSTLGIDKMISFIYLIIIILFIMWILGE